MYVSEVPYKSTARGHGAGPGLGLHTVSVSISWITFHGESDKIEMSGTYPVTSDPRAVTAEQQQPFVPSHSLSGPWSEVVTWTLDGAWDNSANDVLIFFHL